jgi:hypothetical protein
MWNNLFHIYSTMWIFLFIFACGIELINLVEYGKQKT